MTDLDKLARELLADQYDCDLPGSWIAKKLRGEFEGQLRVADINALAAIRTALLAAPPGWKLVPVQPTDAMLRAAQSAWLDDTLRRTTTMWSAMLYAAPEVKP